MPAGKIDPGEDIFTTARRELLEETGYGAAQRRHLGVMHPCVGYSDERIEIYLARAVQREAQPALDAGEFLEVFAFPLPEALAAVRSGMITDAKTITALFWAEKVLLSGWCGAAPAAGIEPAAGEHAGLAGTVAGRRQWTAWGKWRRIGLSLARSRCSGAALETLTAYL